MYRWVVVLAAAFALTPRSFTQSLPPGVSVQQNISYGQHPENVLDVLLPPNAPADRRCGVLAIHAGGWVNGSKEDAVEPLVLPWLTQGCVVANVGYRLAKSAPAPAAVEDVLRAADFFHKNAKRWRVDSGRIIVTGMSAGGHLALMTAMTPKSAKLGPTGKVAAVVNWCGITDVEDQLGGVNEQDYAVTWVPLGTENRMDLARRVSPITHVRKDLPPTLTIHGTADTVVPYEHGVHLTKSLRDVGVDAEMISVSNNGHEFSKETLDKLYVQVFEFAKRRRLLGR